MKSLRILIVVLSFLVSGYADEPFLKPNDVIALVGGEDMVSEGEIGHLEFALQRALPDYRLKVRSLAWEGDTVFEQARMLNYPRLEQQLDEIGATVVLVQFGQSESLAGTEHLPQFIDAYSSLIARLNRPRLVVISPTLFEEAQSQSSPLNTQLAANNASLFEYSSAIRQFAKKRNLPFVDVVIPQGPLVLLGTDDATGKWTPPLEPVVSREGQHISEVGRLFIDGAIVSTIGVKQTSRDLNQPEDERLVRLIQSKNRLWDRYRRPQNWAFLAGDRITQASSRDHLDPKKRWFPEEMKEFIPLIDAKEREIWELAAKLAPEKK